VYDLADKGMTLAIVLLVAGLVVGAGIGFYAFPKSSVTTPGATTTVTVTQVPMQGQVIKLGNIVSTTTNLEVYQPYMQKIVQVNENAYLKLMGYNVSINWLIDNANGDDATHLQKVQGFLSDGVYLFEGGGWSSQASTSLSYVTANNMLEWSCSSTSPTLAIAGDRLYRLCPCDSYTTPAIIGMMWSYGIRDVCIFQRADSWGDGIANLFKPAWTALGGNFTGPNIRYNTASTEFSNYIQTADAQIAAAIPKYGAAHIGTLALMFDECAIIASESAQYPNYYNSIQFGSDGTADNTRLMTDAPTQGAHMQFLSTLASAPNNPLWTQQAAQYYSLVSQPLTSYTAYQDDIGTILMNSVLASGCSNPPKGSDVVNLQAPVANMTFGITGWLELNQYGDRSPPPYDVWQLKPPGQNPAGAKLGLWVIVGSVNAQTDVCTWNTAALGYTPPGAPSS